MHKESIFSGKSKNIFKMQGGKFMLKSWYLLRIFYLYKERFDRGKYNFSSPAGVEKAFDISFS